MPSEEATSNALWFSSGVLWPLYASTAQIPSTASRSALKGPHPLNGWATTATPPLGVMWRMSSLRGANIPRSRKLLSSMPKMSTCPSLASYSAPRKTSILPEYLPASSAALFVAEYELCSVKAMPSRPAPIAASMASSGEDELSCVKAWLCRSIFMLIDKPEELSFKSRCIAVSERAEPRSFRALRELFRGEGGVPEPEREICYVVYLY